MNLVTEDDRAIWMEFYMAMLRHHECMMEVVH
jgi:hypothetical protein